MKIIASIKTLQEFYLRSSRVTDEGIVYLNALKQLRRLDIGECELISGTAKDFLAGLPQLEEFFAARDHAFGDAGAAAVAKLQTLRKVGLANTNLSDKGLRQIAKLLNLNYLDIGMTIVTDKGLDSLTGHQSISSLRLPRTAVSDDVAPVILTMKALGFVDLDNTHISNDAGKDAQWDKKKGKAE